MKRKLCLTTMVLALFMFNACNNEIIESLEDAQNQDFAQTREDISPLEYIAGYEGTMLKHNLSIPYMYIINEYNQYSYPAYMRNDIYTTYIWLETGPLDVRNDNPEDYINQVQYKVGNTHSNEWRYIQMPDNDFGIVKIQSNGERAPIPAYAFPYNDIGYEYEVRIRTIHVDLLTSKPNNSGLYKYDLNLFSPWGYGKKRMYNTHGHNRPQPQTDENGNIDYDSSGFDEKNNIEIQINLPADDDKYSYSCSVYNHNANYVESIQGKLNKTNTSKMIGSKISNQNGGEVEVIAMRTDKSKNTSYYSTTRSYGPKDTSVSITIQENNFFD